MPFPWPMLFLLAALTLQASFFLSLFFSFWRHRRKGKETAFSTCFLYSKLYLLLTGAVCGIIFGALFRDPVFCTGEFFVLVIGGKFFGAEVRRKKEKEKYG